MAQGIAGTYFTSWEFDVDSGSYQLGPIVVIGTDNSITVDGVQMAGAMVAGTIVMWNSNTGNPSSGALTVSFSPTFNAYCFVGMYWTTTDTQPSANNFYGFATQPSAALSSWNNTYNCYTSSEGTDQPAGTLVVSGSSITYSSMAIANPIYTGLNANNTDTNELAWFTSDGNANNVAISFSSSTQTQGVQLFNGCIWPAGTNRPEGVTTTANNFYGTTQSQSDTDQVDQQAQLAQAAENAVVFAAVQKVADALVGNNEDLEAVEAAEHAGNAANENAQQANGAAEEDAAEDVAVDVVEDAAEDAGEDLLEAAALGAAADGGAVPRKEAHAKKPSGLSAKQLLNLKNKP